VTLEFKTRVTNCTAGIDFTTLIVQLLSLGVCRLLGIGLPLEFATLFLVIFYNLNDFALLMSVETNDVAEHLGPTFFQLLFISSRREIKAGTERLL